MKIRMRKKIFFIIILLTSFVIHASGAEGPLVYILPEQDKAVIILGDIPRNVHSFTVFRKDKTKKDFVSLTPGPIKPVKDPYQAMELIGDDVDWIARRMGTIDPSHLWRRLTSDRVMASALCLISPGLRFALGRMLVDKSVRAGGSYTYRVVLLDSREREIKKIEKTVTIKKPSLPAKPRKVLLKAGAGFITASWDYPEYRGGEKDLVVGFFVYRSHGNNKKVLLTSSPVLRVEGALEYRDRDLESDTSYTYYVAAVDLAGNTSVLTESKPIVYKDLEKPLVPMGLTAVDTEEGVLLVWKISPELDVVTYNVYKSTGLNEPFTRINKKSIPLDTPRFIDPGIQRGVALYYRVSALDKSNNESALSGPATIVPHDPDPPGPVTGLSFTLDENKRYITLTWEPLKDKDLAGYYIYRGKNKDSLIRITGDPLLPVKKPVFKDGGYKERGLTPGGEFVYAVTGIDTSSNQGPYEYVKVFIPDNEPPSPPYSFSARSTNSGAVRLRWQPSLSKDLQVHRIYRQAEKEQYKIIAELEKEQNEWIDEQVTKGNTYFYKMTEVDTSGNESEFSKAISLVPLDIVAPLPPPEAQAVSGNKKGVRITWEPSKDNDVKGYLLFRAPYKGARWQQVNKSIITSFQYNDPKGKEGDIYGIAAVDTSGNIGEKYVISVLPEIKNGEEKGE